MYIDPSAGSIVLQLIAGAVLAFTVSIGRARESVRAFFRSTFSRFRR
jgi:uncharacterized membrane protein